MGNNSVFMTESRNPSTLEEAIQIIRETSKNFMVAVKSKDNYRCVEESMTAIKSFDYIVNECLRLRDEFNANSEKLSHQESFLNLLKIIKIGKAAYEISDQEKLNFNTIKHCAVLPSRNKYKNISLCKLMNKLKHRRTDLMGYRIENNRHKFLINCDAFGKENNCIVEFDVSKFCDECYKLVQFAY